MVIVTGGSGYVGSHIVKRLVESGRPVRAMVRNIEQSKNEGRLDGLEVEWVQGDVTQLDSLVDAFDGTTTVIHTVAIAIEKGQLTYEDINVRGTVNVLKAAENAGVRRFINLSQLGADSGLPYRFLASKGKAQEYVAQSNFNWTAFRPSVIWGPEDEFANTFARLFPLTPFIFPIVDRNAQFEPIWVEDVVTCITESLDDENTFSKEYEIGGPEVLLLEEIERRTLEALNSQRRMVSFPKSLLKIAVLGMEKLLPNPPVTSSLLELLQVDNVTKDNSVYQFVDQPRPFTPDNIKDYMKSFRIRDTLKQYLGL